MNSKARLTGVILGIMLLIVAVAAIVTLAISDQLQQAMPPTVVGTATVKPDQIPACADVFVVGKKLEIDGAEFVCKDPDGLNYFSGGWRCNDGRHLWSVTTSTGAKAPGWGFAGEPFQKAVSNNIGADPGYGKAMEACRA